MRAAEQVPEDDGWEPTPPERLIRARLVGADELVEYKDLKVGDVFQAIAPNGIPIDPMDAVLEPGEADRNDDVFVVCIEPPFRRMDGQLGWTVPILIGTLAEVMRRRGN